MHKAMIRGIALLLLLGLLLAACGGSDPDTDAGDEDAQGSGDSDESTFVYVAPNVAPNLDPDAHVGDTTRWLGYEMAGNLWTYDTSSLAEEGCDEFGGVEHLVGELAESWEFNDDRTEVTVTLRDMVSEHGNQLTSEDVRWTWERNLTERPILGVPGVSSRVFGMVDEADPFIEVVDDRTFIMHFAEPSVIDLDTTTWFSYQIVDSTEALKHATDEDPWAEEWLAENSASFGPWRVTEFTPDEEIVLERNENYPLERGNIDRFVMRAVSDPGTRMQLLQTGQSDYSGRLSLDQYSSLADDDAVEIFACRTADIDVLGLNHNDEAMADPVVRRALSLAVDRTALADPDGPYRGFVSPVEQGFSSVYTRDVVGQQFEHDPAEARRLLEEAGYEDGLPITLTFNPTRPGPESEQVAILLQSQLNEAGFDVTLNQIAASADFDAAMRAGDLQMWLNVLPPAVVDISFNMALYYATGGSQNVWNYSSPEMDQLTDALRRRSPDEDASELIRQAADLLYEDLPVIPLVEKRAIKAFRSGIEGHIHQPSAEVFVFTLEK